jgi:hypothetical protein
MKNNILSFRKCRQLLGGMEAYYLSPSTFLRREEDHFVITYKHRVVIRFQQSSYTIYEYPSLEREKIHLKFLIRRYVPVDLIQVKGSWMVQWESFLRPVTREGKNFMILAVNGEPL